MQPSPGFASLLPTSPRQRRVASSAALVALLLAGPLAGSAQAAAVVVPLGTSAAFSVLAGSTVTNTGTTTIERSVGVAPGTAVTGAGTMTVGGTYHQADAVARQAKSDLTTAYTNAAGQTPRIAQDPELGGETLVGGVYNRSAAMALTGVLTLDGQNDPDTVWVFQAGTTLTTASASSVVLINGANPCNVFWQVGSSATMGTGSSLVGTVMADQTITMRTGATLQGRVLARIGAVNLQANVITTPGCAYDVDVAEGETSPTSGGDTGGNTGGNGGNGGDTGGTTPGDNTGGNGGNGGGNGGGGGGGSQITTVPSGGVDTGQAGVTAESPDRNASITGWVLAAGAAGLVVLAVRRRRHV